MQFELGEAEKQLLSCLKEGFSKILVYKTGRYPTAVSFVLENEKVVTVRSSEKAVAPCFEVFPIQVSEDVIRRDPEKVIECRNEGRDQKISILQKSDWTVPATEKDKARMLGDPDGSMVQFEGKSTDIPANALSNATLQAGLKIEGSDGWSFQVATSMFPYALYVSDCDFSESANSNVYESLELE